MDNLIKCWWRLTTNLTNLKFFYRTMELKLRNSNQRLCVTYIYHSKAKNKEAQTFIDCRYPQKSHFVKATSGEMSLNSLTLPILKKKEQKTCNLSKLCYCVSWKLLYLQQSISLKQQISQYFERSLISTFFRLNIEVRFKSNFHQISTLNFSHAVQNWLFLFRHC